MILSFAKYEGAGNDFIVIDARTFDFEPSPEFVASLCDRRFGIGADGLMLLGLGRGKAEFDTRFYNSDGFETSMSGNGGCCIALYAHHQGIGGREKVFSAVDGMHQAKIVKADDLSGLIELQLNHVGKIHSGENHMLLDTGSPHYVKFVPSLGEVDVVAEGREIRYDPAYGKKGVNVNFVEITGKGAFRLRTYERGIEDETLACGTGATASAIAVHLAKQPDVNKFHIAVKGGELTVSFRGGQDGRISNVWLCGETRKVFHGKFETDNFPVII